MKISLNKLIIIAAFAQSSAFSVVTPGTKLAWSSTTNLGSPSTTTLFNAAEPTDEEMATALEGSKLSDEEVEKVGNLVADDEWMGLGMELSEIVRCAVIEEVKKNTADFIGSEDYKVGDITKEVDSRVKVSVVKRIIFYFGF
jgi:hypothetical protein